MADSVLTLQGAIYTALTSPTSVGASVYDAVPESAAYPHIEIGQDDTLDWSAAVMRGEIVDVTIHVWSRYRGFKEAKMLMKAVKDRLHEASLSLTGSSLVDIRFQGSQLFTDADGLTRHGVLFFRVWATS